MGRLFLVLTIWGILIVPSIDLKILAQELAKGVKAKEIAGRLGEMRETDNHNYKVIPNDKRYSMISIARDDRGFIAKSTEKKPGRHVS